MNEDFVSFELAVKLKEKGFREKCLLHYESTGGFYSNSIDTYDKPNQELDYSDFLKCFNGGNSIGLIDAPTISQVLKWLREEQSVFVEIGVGFSIKIHQREIREGEFVYYRNLWYEEEAFPTYEEAALAGIKYCLDNLI